MKISMNWINEYVDTRGIDIKELAYRFTMSTAEIEGVEVKGADIKNVVVGKIVSCENIANSQKLHNVEVDVGNQIVKCVCGAPNAKAGITIPFAKAGGGIVGIPEIKSVMLANNESNGVCCSAKELGISDDHSGLMILPDNLKAGTDIKEVLPIDDIIIEIDNKSITNRPDLWGHYGVAREIAAIIGSQLRYMPMTELYKFDNLAKIPVEIKDEKCIRYDCMSFENIKREESPYYMQVRLFYCGMRAINFLVDLTNYIMLDIGQPMHAFDKEGIEKIVVRSSRGEKFVTLDDVERDIDRDTLFICNNDEPIALAGVMGGKYSEVTDKTKSIILESANFDAGTIRRTASKLNMRTEASARYEKTLDSEYTIDALKRFVYLLMQLDENAVVSSSLSDNVKKIQEKKSIKIEKQYIDKYIGEELSMDKIVSILTSLKFSVMVNGNILLVDVPSFRASKDISIKADIVEEISRMYGFDNIKPQPINVKINALEINQNRECEHKVKEVLADKFGFSEVFSYLWYDNKFNKEVGIGELKGIKILSPSAPEFADIREYMIPTLLSFAEKNRKNFDEFGIFEIGSVAMFDGEVKEHKTLGILLASKKESEDDLFYKVKAITENIFKIIKNTEIKCEQNKKGLAWIHPVKSVNVLCNDTELGIISVLHPKIRNNIDKKLNIAFAEIDMFKAYEIYEKGKKFIEPSKYPEINYDLSLLVDKAINYAIIKKDIDEFKNDIMIGAKLVEIYEGDKGLPDGKKSITFNFKWGAPDHTLTREEVDEGKQELLEYLKGKGYASRY